jgi:hypothetical protein
MRPAAILPACPIASQIGFFPGQPRRLRLNPGGRAIATNGGNDPSEVFPDYRQGGLAALILGSIVK